MADNYRSYSSSELQKVIDVALSARKAFGTAAEAVRKAQTTLRTVSTAGGNLSGGGTEAVLSRISTTCLQFTELENDMKELILKVNAAKEEMDRDDASIEQIDKNSEIEGYRNGGGISDQSVAKDWLDAMSKASGDPEVWDNIGDYTQAKYRDRYQEGEIGWAEAELGRAGAIFGGSVMTTIDAALNIPGLLGEAIGMKGIPAVDLPSRWTYKATVNIGNRWATYGRYIDRAAETAKSAFGSWKNYGGTSTVHTGSSGSSHGGAGRSL